MRSISIPIAGTPEKCPDCKAEPVTWPISVFAGRLYVTCPACHQRAAEINAI